MAVEDEALRKQTPEDACRVQKSTSSEDYPILPPQFLQRQHSNLLQSIEDALADHFSQLQDLSVEQTGEPISPRSTDKAVSPRTTEQLRDSLVSATPVRPALHRGNSTLSARSGRFKTTLSQHSQGRIPVGHDEFLRRESIHSYGSIQVKKQATARETIPDDLAAVKGKSKLTPKEVPRFTQRLVLSDSFEWVSALLIVSNAIFYGVEAQVAATDPMLAQSRPFEMVSDIFTGFFVLEVLLRIVADVKGFCCGKQRLWNLFDTLIVAMSLAERASRAVPHLSFVRIVRLTRTVRLYRTVQYLRVFTGLRILVSSVVNTLRSLAWTMFLLASILYVFALLFTQTALDYLRDVEQDPVTSEGLIRHFGTLLQAVSTLFKCITNGLSWHEASEPLGAVHPLWEVIFCIFVSFTYLAVLNVVTGVFCQSAIESANRDKDGIVQHQITLTEKYTNELKSLFKQIDAEATGVVTLTMFEEFLKDNQMKAYFNGMDMSCDDAWNLFKLLDSNESCGVDIEEFVTGCLRLQGSARSIDTHMLLYESRWTMKRLHEISNSLRNLGAVCEANFAVLLPGDGDDTASTVDTITI